MFIHTQTCRFTESGVDFSLVSFLVNYNRLSYEKLKDKLPSESKYIVIIRRIFDIFKKIDSNLVASPYPRKNYDGT